MNRKRLSMIITSAIIIFVSFINLKISFIRIPDPKDLVDLQVDFITISTVFAGFSFTTLGLLLGLSSEKLIERIKDTSIVSRKVDKMMTSITYFLISVFVSLIFILGVNESIFGNLPIFDGINSLLYVIGIGYLFFGIVTFIISVYGLYDLIKRIYQFNRNKSLQKIEAARKTFEEKKKETKENNEK